MKFSVKVILVQLLFDFDVRGQIFNEKLYLPASSRILVYLICYLKQLSNELVYLDNR